MTAPLRYRARARLTLRSTWVVVASAMLAASSIVSAWTAVRVEVGVRHDRVERCEERTVARAEVRRAIEAGVDEVAIYAELDPVARAAVVERVQARVARELPPPHC